MADLKFETGTMSKEEIKSLLEEIPIDITFIDSSDRVKYYNRAEKRSFKRPISVIGRKVQKCHPKKSIDTVNRIIESFRNNEKDNAEFWIKFDKRLVYIRYFAVRNNDGEYLGTLEVTQDITDIQSIKGEKRLLDWKE